MFVIGNILIGIANTLAMGFNMYKLIMFGRAIVSWVNADPYNPLVRFLMMAVDPVTARIRRYLPASLRFFPLDISFVVLFALVIFSEAAIVQTLFDLGRRLRS